MPVGATTPTSLPRARSASITVFTTKLLPVPATPVSSMLSPFRAYSTAFRCSASARQSARRASSEPAAPAAPAAFAAPAAPAAPFAALAARGRKMGCTAGRGRFASPDAAAAAAVERPRFGAGEGEGAPAEEEGGLTSAGGGASASLSLSTAITSCGPAAAGGGGFPPSAPFESPSSAMTVTKEARVSIAAFAQASASKFSPRSTCASSAVPKARRSEAASSL